MRTQRLQLDIERESGRICRVCQKEATVRPFERLPNDGLAMRAVHADGTTLHTWCIYGSFSDIGRRRTKEHRVRMRCPRRGCNKIGIIGWLRPDLSQPEKIEYHISHGISKKEKFSSGRPKEIRHHFSKKPERDLLLKKLGRYIEP